jgi:hypothetical protein
MEKSRVPRRPRNAHCSNVAGMLQGSKEYECMLHSCAHGVMYVDLDSNVLRL